MSIQIQLVIKSFYQKCANLNRIFSDTGIFHYFTNDHHSFYFYAFNPKELHAKKKGKNSKIAPTCFS